MIYPTIDWNNGPVIGERDFPDDRDIQEVLFVLRSEDPSFHLKPEFKGEAATMKKVLFEKKRLEFDIDEKRKATVFVYVSDVALRNFLCDDDIQHFLQSVAPWLFTYGTRQITPASIAPESF